ncbi:MULTISPECIES: cell wall metabolism sensor histidine kinase WalK [unclassified Bacillus (in: firmicutes)]|uniref:sensor histidine kinase n=1 Tax=unclassified Bacillus (in: firmicutes) TaxID=185979 RepID=UPI0008EF4187|nr:MULTISPECIES: HAMP domain-containing sensor histidine kinase [unclassified Bacillus (in: firmicutes)]SFA80430.1 Signal transduction histidine kinase [Bacillus sp. UNCCL13]SFQ70497.1 Signal transduction histidine kinase [Bacillus sp. cl95]
MKFKYFHQLLLSHISVLLIAFFLLWLLFYSFLESFIYQNKVEELQSFGVQIITDLTDPTEVSPSFLKHYNDLLQARNIRFYLFDGSGKVVGSKEAQPPLVKLTEEEWNDIQNGKSVMVKHDLERFKQEVTLVALPYMENHTLLGGVLLASPISGAREIIQQINQYFLLTVAFTLIVTFLLSGIISKYYVKRINRIREATSMISAGDYHFDIPFSGYDEIGGLAEDFNRMGGKLRDSQQEIERLENRRRQFIADVSHELRTPLTTISGLVEGIRNDMIPREDQKRSMDLINQETKRLIRLVNENLDYEKIRSNQIKLTKEEIDLIEVLEVIKEHLDGQAHLKNNEIILEIEAGISVTADYDRLLQILLNITKNSIQFTSDGSIYLRGWQSPKETTIEIEDTGSGIDPEEIESIWHRFYKADLSRTSNAFGEFGLGLSIVKKLVELHNGSISVSSEKNMGTKFLIKLPATY